MKKNYLFAIAIAALLFSCTKESVDNSSINMNDNSISFDTYTTVSKGTPITSNAGLQNSAKSFGVMGFLGSSPYLFHKG